MTTKPMNKQFVLDFRDMCDVYAKRQSDGLLDRYWQALQHYQQDQLSRVAAYLLETCQRWPTVADWMAAIRQGIGKPQERAALPPPTAPDDNPCPGIARYIGAACGGKKNAIGAAILRQGGPDKPPLRVTGDSYRERLGSAVEAAENEGAAEATIRVLRAAAYDLRRIG